MTTDPKRMLHHYDSAPPDCASQTDDATSGGMQGFDPEFQDIVDYILRITYRIWEGKQIGLCHDYYADDCPVYTLAGYTEGAEQVTQNTLRTLSAFPDRTLHADNVIWGGDAQSGYHTSHLICSNMTNLGPSEFGEPTMRRAQIRVIAHCICKDNKIVKEWLVRDNYALAEQLGIDPLSHAREQAMKPLDAESEFATWLSSESARVKATSRDRVSYPRNHGDLEGLVRSGLQNIWNARMLGDCQLIYAENARLHASARDDYDGVDQITRFYVELMGALPDARISVDYTCTNSMRDGDHVAARWVVAGNHDGAALWGDPTGAAIVILGESHYHFVDGKVMEEWLVFDELAVRTQVERARINQRSADI